MATQAMMELEEHVHGPEAAGASSERRLPRDALAEQRLFSDDEEEEEADEHDAKQEIDDIVECSQFPPDAIPQPQDLDSVSTAPNLERSRSSRITLASLFTPPSTQPLRQQRAAALSPQPALSCGSIVLRPAIRPPSCSHTTEQLLQLGVPPVVVSNHDDAMK
jgi:hypothetical protein